MPGAVGYIQEALGYINFFWFVMACCLATVIGTALIKVDPMYGVAKKNEVILTPNCFLLSGSTITPSDPSAACLLQENCLRSNSFFVTQFSQDVL